MLSSNIKIANLLHPLRISTIANAIFNPNNELIIGTHDGSFHCDESLASGLLKLLPQYHSSIIVRTRNPGILAQCNIVVDVGAVYDAENNRFDHHQRGFEHTLNGFETKLSSAGLVYKHFGKDIIKAILSYSTNEISEEFLEASYIRLYKDFVEHIDAIDNGVSIADGPLRYHISSTLSARVGCLNPQWNEAQTPEILNERFKEAMLLTSFEFISQTKFLYEAWWPARSIVQKALEDRFKFDSGGRVLILSQACPWKEHLFELESIISVYIFYTMYYI
jgi:uncharacterized UPF0160 family protein